MRVAPATAPIVFRGVEHRAAKGFLGASHRICPPEVTLERVKPLLAGAGITRMADITGLDRIGVPTVLAMRPNAPTLANASGKGFTRTAAMVSAAMEGIELHYGEEFSPRTCGDGHGAGLEATYRELERDGLVCPLEHLPLTRSSIFEPDSPEDWVIGFDVAQQRPMAVPFACVGMRSSVFRERSRFSFQVGSNGLSSGNAFLEALCSGLAEVVERDAVTCAKLRCGGHLELERRVDLESIADESVAELVDRFRSAGVGPVVYDCTGDTAVPVYMAYLLDDLKPSTGVFSGYGAHLHPAVAIVRALTEAAQSRAVYIAGSRDDLMSLEHRRMRRVGAQRSSAAVSGGSVSATQLPPSAAAATFEQDCATFVERIRRVGLDHVIVVDLAPPELPISVVRVVVPGLEGYSSFAHYTPGRRGLAAQRSGRETPADRRAGM